MSCRNLEAVAAGCGPLRGVPARGAGAPWTNRASCNLGQLGVPGTSPLRTPREPDPTRGVSSRVTRPSAPARRARTGRGPWSCSGRRRRGRGKGEIECFLFRALRTAWRKQAASSVNPSKPERCSSRPKHAWRVRPRRGRLKPTWLPTTRPAPRPQAPARLQAFVA